MSKLTAIHNDLRRWINSEEVNISDVARDSGINLSWLSKFKRRAAGHPRIDTLIRLEIYRDSLGGTQPARLKRKNGKENGKHAANAAG